MLVCCFCSRIAAWTLLRLMGCILGPESMGPYLKTRASAVKTLQKVSGLIRTGTLSMQCASSPAIQDPAGACGERLLPIRKLHPKSQRSKLVVPLHASREGWTTLQAEQNHGALPASDQDDTAACSAKTPVHDYLVPMRGRLFRKGIHWQVPKRLVCRHDRCTHLSFT